MNGYKVIVNKSTVPVGTAKQVREIIKKEIKDKSFGFDVVSNPEFLRESTAIHDTFHGERIVIGSNSKRAIRIMKELYSPLSIPYLVTMPESAEMIKYASNAYLATKISFINEIAMVCEKVGANVKDVAEGMGMDKRIGRSFLNAGIGFGGACFPKDVLGLIKIGEKVGYDIRIARETLEINNVQRVRPVKILKEYFGSIKDKKIGLLGLAFKSGTDDMREAPSAFIIEALTLAGAHISAYDPIAMENSKNSIRHKVNYCDNPYSLAKGCDAVLLLTDWPEFYNMDLGRIKRSMKSNVFVDGRNVLSPRIMRSYGFRYFSIGVTNNNLNSSNCFMKFAKKFKPFRKSNQVMATTI